MLCMVVNLLPSTVFATGEDAVELPDPQRSTLASELSVQEEPTAEEDGVYSIAPDVGCPLPGNNTENITADTVTVSDWDQFIETYDNGVKNFIVDGQITIPEGMTLSLGGDREEERITLTRATGYTGTLLFAKDADLTLNYITLDGGAKWEGTPDPTLQRGTENNGMTANETTKTWLGGQLLFVEGGNLTICEGLVLENNHISNTGLDYCYGSALTLHQAECVMSGGEIRNNAITTGMDGYGAGVCLWDSSFKMLGGKVYGNALYYTEGPGKGSYQRGGGIYGIGGDDCFIKISGGEVSHNYCDGVGGGIEGDNQCRIEVSGSTKITYNKAAHTAGGVLSAGEFTMTGGEISYNEAGRFGGVSVIDGTMAGGVIKENVATGHDFRAYKQEAEGGGMGVSGAFTMSGGEISDNTADYGSAVWIETAGSGCHFTFEGGIIRGTAAKDGGGVYVKDGNFTMSNDASLADCHAEKDGGGVYVESGNFTMRNNASLTDCHAKYGGAVYVMDDTFTMEDAAAIHANTAEKGGAVYASGGTFTMKGSASIYDNYAQGGWSSQGGGVYGRGLTFIMENGTTIRNNSAKYGGGVYMDSEAFTMAKGATICNNYADTAGADIYSWTITPDTLSLPATGTWILDKDHGGEEQGTAITGWFYDGEGNRWDPQLHHERYVPGETVVVRNLALKAAYASCPHASYDDWEVTKEPSCTEKGTKQHSCSECGRVETGEIDALGHSFPDTWSDVCVSHTDADCAQHEKVCTRCNGTLAGGTLTEDHTYGDWQVTKVPTAIELGEREHICTACEHKETEKMAKISVLEQYAVYEVRYYEDDVLKETVRLFGKVGEAVTADTASKMPGGDWRVSSRSILTGEVKAPTSLLDEEGNVIGVDILILEVRYESYAQCRETFTVTYDLNGGDANGKDYSTVTVKSGTIVTVKDAPVRDGYTFTDWDDGTSACQPGATLTVLKNITLTAQWENAPVPSPSTPPTPTPTAEPMPTADPTPTPTVTPTPLPATPDEPDDEPDPTPTATPSDEPGRPVGPDELDIFDDPNPLGNKELPDKEVGRPVGPDELDIFDDPNPLANKEFPNGEPTLPQTGQHWMSVFLLAGAGALMLLMGLIGEGRYRGKHEEE